MEYQIGDNDPSTHEKDFEASSEWICDSCGYRETVVKQEKQDKGFINFLRSLIGKPK